MTEPLVLVAPALIRPALEPHIPSSVVPHWFASRDEGLARAPLADIGWFDMGDPRLMADVITAATRMRWLNTLFAGLDMMPTALLAERGVTLTSGKGLNALAVADYAVLGVLTLAKRFDEVVRARDRHEWLTAAPGQGELDGSKALVVGMGEIGSAIAARLAAFGVTVTGVRRTADPVSGVIGPDDWKPRLGEYDWVILAAPSTDSTKALLGAAEFAAMKAGSGFINIARGDMVDQDALIAALDAGTPAAAFLDVTDPEPLPPGNPLWGVRNCLISMHMSGRSQTSVYAGAARRFLANLGRYVAGEPLHHMVDLARGY